MTNIPTYFKLLILLPLLLLAACSTNQATGRNQFTGLMPASQEAAIGAQEHEKILQQFGGEVEDESIKAYVTRVGKKIVPFTERSDVNYTFTVLDTYVVNAFALPGGYVYVTRGILQLANNEAELAAVIAHEIGHVTARHSAERYSASVVTGLGASLISAALDVNGASEALGIGASLYLNSYSRSQEHEADDLGVRYLSRAGYDPAAMSSFLRSLEASAVLEAKEAGLDIATGGLNNYFSTHPVTQERVIRTASAAMDYPDNGNTRNRIEYLRAINGLIIGDSEKQGFFVNSKFVHPDLGFSFNIPDGYKTSNQPSAVVAQGTGGSIVFTAASKRPNQSISDFVRMEILGGDMSTARDFGTNRINGMNTASVEQPGMVNGKQSNVRFVAIEWDADTVYQFALAIPAGTPAMEVQDLQKSVFSFKKLSNSEKRHYKPKTLGLRVAKAGDTIQSISSDFPYDDTLNAERFRVLNGLMPNEGLLAQNVYKVITQ